MDHTDDARPSGLDEDASGEADLLLRWYDRHRRDLPWRAKPGAATADPYAVWLSEIMLQQTTVAAVKAYYQRFLALWPTIEALAAAPVEEVMKAWAGLGYYSRARNLHQCARLVAAAGGHFPREEIALRRLPGIGAYTAAAIAAIAFDQRAVVIDGNVERVVSRLDAIETPLPAAKPIIAHLADSLTPDRRPGDHAQAMMDLGATICTPRKPACALCPLNARCLAFKEGTPERYPLKARKAERPARAGAAFVARRADGAVLVRRRPPKGLLGGMLEVPTTDWSTAKAAALYDPRRSILAAPLAANWRKAGSVDHVFTHFSLRLEVLTAELAGETPAPQGMTWAPGELAREAFPTVFRKVIETGQRRNKG